MGLSLGGIGKGPSKLAFGFKSAQNKAKPIAAFAAEDSDDEGEVTREAKKQRTTGHIIFCTWLCATFEIGRAHV